MPTTSQSPITNQAAASDQDKQVMDRIAQALAGLLFGSVEIIVHEGKVTQIERKEKFRLQR